LRPKVERLPEGDLLRYTFMDSRQSPARSRRSGSTTRRKPPCIA